MSDKRIVDFPHPFHHIQDLQLRFNDVDIFGHINNTIYLQFYDLAKLEYYKAVMGPDFDMTKIVLVIVNINCDFYAPAFHNERLVVQTATSRIGEKSVTLEQRLINADTGQVKSRCVTILSGFDTKTMKPADIQPEWRERICRFEGRQF